MKYFFIFFFLLALQACATRSTFVPHFETHELYPTRSWSVLAPDFNTPRFDPSGLFVYEGKLLTVSDRKEYNDIYELVEADRTHLQAKTFLPVKLPAEKLKEARHDFEAITFCGGRFYIADEGNADVIEVNLKGKVKIYPLDMKSIHTKTDTAPASGTKNGGIEGIACDEDHQNFYISNERHFRMIYTLKRGDWIADDFFDLPSGWNLPRVVRNLKMYADFADLFYSNGYLYALQRNDRKILKIDLAQRKIVTAVALNFDEHDYYDSSEPFGMSEGLVLEKNRILIVLDNNGMKQKALIEGISPILFEFPRPKNF